MSNGDEDPSKKCKQLNDSPSERPIAIKPVIDYEDVTSKALELLKQPHALLNKFLDIQRPRSLCDPMIQILAFYLLPRLKLDFPIRTRYLDRYYEDAVLNSSVVNQTYEILPTRYQERFIDNNPLSGFTQFFARKDIDPGKTDRVDLSLSATPQQKAIYQKEVSISCLALELLFDDVASINEDLGSDKLADYQQQPSDKRTAELIDGLGDYFARNDYGGINYHQLVILAECISYVKRFYRNRWRVEDEDVLEAWYLINYCRTPRPPLQRSDNHILHAIEMHNREGVFPSQRQIIKQSGLATKTVNAALGLKINSGDGRGKLLTIGYVKYDESQKGYSLTELGKIALTNDFYVSIDGRTYRPKNPLDLE